MFTGVCMLQCGGMSQFPAAVWCPGDDTSGSGTHAWRHGQDHIRPRRTHIFAGNLNKPLS